MNKLKIYNWRMKIIIIWNDELRNENYKNWEIMKWRIKIIWNKEWKL